MILALDFETANGDAGSICSVGIASLGGGGEIEREEILIRPHDSCSRFSCFNVMIHGIRPDMVRNAPYFCTCKLARRLWPGLENHRLNTLCDYLGFRFEHHQAGEDAAAAAFIVRRMLEATGAADWRELLEKLRVNPGLVSPRGCVGCRVVPKGKSR